MRIYVIIIAVAIALLGTLIIIAQSLMPAFVGSETFWQAMVTETISFIVTTAVIGSLSAAVLRWLDERKSRPIREYALRKIDERLICFLEPYQIVVNQGSGREYSYDYTVAFGSTPLQKYVVIDSNGLADRAMRAREHAMEVRDLLNRFSAHFPIELQDDISHLVDFLHQREELLYYFILLIQSRELEPSQTQNFVNYLYSQLSNRLGEKFIGWPEAKNCLQSLSADGTLAAYHNSYKRIVDRDTLMETDVDSLVIVLFQSDYFRSIRDGDEFSRSAAPQQKSDLIFAAARVRDLVVDLDAIISDAAAHLPARIHEPAKGFDELEDWDKLLCEGDEATLVALQRHLADYVSQEAREELATVIEARKREQWPLDNV